jgi:hypothetical protein
MLTLPSGTIRTRRPNSTQAFGFPWADVERWNILFSDAAHEWQHDPRLLAAMAVVETDANHVWPSGPRKGQVISVDDGLGDGPSVGIMQVKPQLWGDLIPGIDARKVADNIRLGSALMRGFIHETGSWQNAIRQKYHPGTSGVGTTPQHYVDTVQALMDEMGGPVPDEINWTPLPRPAMRRAIVTKAQVGDGFSRTTSRWPRTIGCCNHITDGDPAGDEIEFYRAFFSIGGERARDALVDTVIARTGEIGLLNDWEDDAWGGTRAGWANGGTDGLTAIGSAIVAKYPGNQINEVLVSKEHVARSGQSLTDSQMASSIALSSYVAQRAQVRWDSYPRNSAGLHVDPLHTDFAAKACPAEPFISTYYPVLLREVKAVLTKHQTGSTNPNPPPDPEPVPGVPAWATFDHVRAAFPDADPAGIVTKAYLRYITVTGTLPIYRERRTIDGDSSLWVFDRTTILHEKTVAKYEGEG